MGIHIRKIIKLIIGEVPIGDINEINVTYILNSIPISGTVIIYLNGIRQQEGVGKDYTVLGDTITFIVPPDTGDIILADYQV